MEIGQVGGDAERRPGVAREILRRDQHPVLLGDADHFRQVRQSAFVRLDHDAAVATRFGLADVRGQDRLLV